uniref:Uncharacterized protein n=1 Tax=uncultured bacterium pAB2 TaxID=1448270 RepID=W5VKE6_9BACT|nr:hypothetical protein [uncultured bacterium pAB2]
MPEIALAQAAGDAARVAHPVAHNAQVVTNKLAFRCQAYITGGCVCRHAADRILLVVVRHLTVDYGAGQCDQCFFVGLPFFPCLRIVVLAKWWRHRSEAQCFPVTWLRPDVKAQG